jgi:hypothetical protein
MKRTKKTEQQQETQKAVVQPRLVKAGELAAREAAQAVEADRKPEVKAKTPAVDAALRRPPRNAIEARSMFEALFGEDKAA